MVVPVIPLPVFMLVMKPGSLFYIVIPLQFPGIFFFSPTIVVKGNVFIYSSNSFV